MTMILLNFQKKILIGIKKNYLTIFPKNFTQQLKPIMEPATTALEATTTTETNNGSLLPADEQTVPQQQRPSFAKESEEKAFNEILELVEKDRPQMTRYQEYYVFEAEPNYHCLVRYLRARDFDVKKSYDLLKSTLQWLEEFKPYLITATKMTKEAATGKIFCRGFDKFNRPVIYMSPGRENTYDGEGNIQLLVYSLFTAVARMSPGVSQMTWVCNFEGYTMKVCCELNCLKFFNSYNLRLFCMIMSIYLAPPILLFCTL